MDKPTYRAGMPINDQCRVCKEFRGHTVVVVGENGRPLRVICDYCRSQHNYRGQRRTTPAAITSRSRFGGSSPTPIPLVDQSELVAPTLMLDDSEVDPMELEKLLRQILREEGGLTAVAPADKWVGGEMVLKPGREGVKEYSMPIEAFFRKIVSVRNKLRVLEQQINASNDIPDAQKLKLHGYITGAYGSLTSFNQLFAEKEDHFK